MTNAGGTGSGPPSNFPPGPSLSSMPRRSSYASVVSGNPAQAYYVSARNPAFPSALHSMPSNSYPPPSYPDPRLPRTTSGFETDNAPSGIMSGYGQRTAPFPSYSRRFSSLVSANTPNSFFVPTYLRHSQYVAKLRSAHNTKPATRKDGPLNSLSTNSSSASLHRPAQSHRGMTFEVVENPPSKEESCLAPLPSRWNEADRFPGLEITGDGREVRYAGSTSRMEQQEAAAVRADHRMPSQSGIYYFEVEITSKHKDGMVAIGFSGSKASLERLPGWESESWAYHSDDGKSFFGESTGKTYGPTFGVNDVIGCGINFITGSAFFTKNGISLGIAFRDLKNVRAFPSVGVKRHASATIKANFGQSPFVFDIDGLVERERINIEREIAITKISTRSSSLDETTLVQEFVAQFLAHDGYVETARAFNEAKSSEADALQIHQENNSPSQRAEQDLEAVKRQRIRAAILEGDIDKALKHTNAYYQRVLEENPQIVFRLKCRKFIELIRKTIELQTQNSPIPGSTTNGHSQDTDVFDQDMEMDGSNDGEEWDKMDTEEASSSIKYQELVQEAMEYGQMLNREYRDDKPKKKALDDAFSLWAYDDAKSSVHGHLLESSGRVPVAEELNAAILVSLGKSSSASIEKLYQQTEALVNELGEDGGVGTLINVKERFLP